jgi:hypothetical protein
VRLGERAHADDRRRKQEQARDDNGVGPPASGTSRSGSGNRTQPTTSVGPTPIQRDTGPATAEPTSPPIAPTPRTSPSVPGDTPSSRVAKRTKRAKKTKLKKLIVAVATSVERTTADPAIQRSPR